MTNIWCPYLFLSAINLYNLWFFWTFIPYKKRYDELIAYFNYQENIWASQHLIGGDDVELDIYIENEDKYMQFLDSLRSKFFDIIKNAKTIKYFETLKYNLFPIVID